MLMGTIPLDYSFEREGVGLADWLWRLVDPNSKTRQAAGNALQAMDRGLPSNDVAWTELVAMPDFAAQRRRFVEAVRQTLAHPEFDTAEFVRRLIAYRLALADEHRRQTERIVARQSKRDNQFERLAEQIAEPVAHAGNESEKMEAEAQFARLCALYVCGSVSPCDDPPQEAELTSTAGLMAYALFSFLSTELLAAPEALRRLLQDDPLNRGSALAALAQIGPAAAGFSPELLAELNALPREDRPASYSFDGATALGSIGRGQPEMVATLLRCLESPSPQIRRSALNGLERMGPDVCGQEEAIARRLATWLDHEEEDCSPVFAFASVGRHLPWVRQRVLEMARPRPAQWRPFPGFPQYSYDYVMGERGAALDAIRYLSDYPDECIPILVDTMTTFEEYDPDESFDGSLSRIARVISHFGPQGAAAARPLVSHLRDEDEQSPNGILRALAAMGPAAQAILPELYAFRKEGVDEAMLPDLETSEADEYSDLIGWAIQRIQGR